MNCRENILYRRKESRERKHEPLYTEISSEALIFVRTQ